MYNTQTVDGSLERIATIFQAAVMLIAAAMNFPARRRKILSDIQTAIKIMLKFVAVQTVRKY